MVDSPAGADLGPFAVGALVGSLVRLEPLARSHVAALAAAAGGDRSTYTYTRVPAGVDDTSRYVDQLLDERRSGLCVPFVQVRLADDRVVGATRFMTLRSVAPGATPFAVEIGGTWISHSAQRSGVNTEAKLLLLDFAFGDWSVARVDLKTDARNRRSWTAIERIGATCEGVLRQWQPSLVVGEEDVYRDSAMFSVVREEWPERRSHLVALIEEAR